jgi:organic radical activating enzyme
MLDTNEVRIETSTICNQKCVFCPYTKYFTRKKEIMTDETFIFLVDKVKDEAPQITELTISGMGEIFLDPNILNKIDYGNKKGFNVHVITNGTGITKDHIDFIIDKVTDITFSLHSLNPENWSKITGCPPELYERVIHNIDYVLQYKKHPRVRITCDVIDINEGEVQEIINTYNDRVYNLEIWNPHNWVDTFDYRDTTLRHKYSCGRPERSPIQIQVDGTINMCCFDYNGKLLLGDFKKNTLEEIFNSKYFIELKNGHANEFLENYICYKCDQRLRQKDVLIYSKLYKPEERIGTTSTTFSSVRKKTKVYINAQMDTGKTILKNFINKHLYLSETSTFQNVIYETDIPVITLMRDPRVCWFVTIHKYSDAVYSFTIDEYIERRKKHIQNIISSTERHIVKFEDILSDKVKVFNHLAKLLNITLVRGDTFEYTEVFPINNYFTKFDLHKIEKYIGRVQQSELDYISEKLKDEIEFFGYEKQLTIFNMLKGAL